MTNDIYNRPAVLPSEAVMIPAAESGDLGARPRSRPSLDTIRKGDARMTAAQQAKRDHAAVPTMWIAPQQEPLHNEAQAPVEQPASWLGRAALRSITSGMPDVAPMPESTSHQPIGPAPQAQPSVSTRGALRSVVADLVGGRSNQPTSFRPVQQAQNPLTLPAARAISLPPPSQEAAVQPEA